MMGELLMAYSEELIDVARMVEQVMRTNGEEDIVSDPACFYFLDDLATELAQLGHANLSYFFGVLASCHPLLSFQIHHEV